MKLLIISLLLSFNCLVSFAQFEGSKQIYNNTTGDLFWRFYKAMDDNITTSSDQLIERMMEKFQEISCMKNKGPGMLWKNKK